MEGKKEVGSSSSSSLASELFGSKEAPSSSSGIFGSIFSPRGSMVLGRESLRPDGMANKQYQTNEAWNTKPGAYGDTSKGHEGEDQNTQKVQPYGPCHLSSSIYYGGPDVVSHPQSTQASGVNSMYKKDGGEDDSGSVSRGNWWKGSLYY